MKHWLNKVWLLSKYEKLLMIRTRKGILLILMMIGLGILSIILELTGAPKDIYKFNDILFTAYNIYFQFLPIALAVILADAISGEKERKTWNFFMSKPFTKMQFLLSKFLTDYIVVSLAIVLMWGIVFIIAKTITSEMNCSWGQFLTLIVISEAVVFAIVAFEITISAVSKRVSVAVLLIVISWILLMIFNMAIPLWRGFIAPWAVNSYQTSVITRLLNTGPKKLFPFEYLIGYPSINEIFASIWIPLAEGIVFYIFAILTIKR